MTIERKEVGPRMSQIVIDAEMRARLEQVREPVDLVDENGRKWGRYTPEPICPWDPGLTAAGLPEDSHIAIFASVELGAEVVPEDAAVVERVAPGEARPSDASVTGPAMPSTASPWLR